MKKKLSQKQLIKKILSTPLPTGLQKLALELKKTKWPHPWSPEDGVIMDGKLVKERISPEIVLPDDVMSLPTESSSALYSPEIQKARQAMIDAGELPVGLGGTFSFEKWKNSKSERIMHAFWEEHYTEWLTWKHIWIWIKRRIQNVGK